MKLRTAILACCGAAVVVAQVSAQTKETRQDNAAVCHTTTALQTAEFQRPWDDPKTALVIDPYYANTIDWDKLKTEPRIVAIIHKATIGASKLDPAYFTRKEEAKKRGYLWGSYHWGVSRNPEEQADYLNPRKNTPSIAQAWMEMNFASWAFRPRLTCAIVSTVL